MMLRMALLWWCSERCDFGCEATLFECVALQLNCGCVRAGSRRAGRQDRAARSVRLLLPQLSCPVYLLENFISRQNQPKRARSATVSKNHSAIGDKCTAVGEEFCRDSASKISVQCHQLAQRYISSPRTNHVFKRVLAISLHSHNQLQYP